MEDSKLNELADVVRANQEDREARINLAEHLSTLEGIDRVRGEILVLIDRMDLFAEMSKEERDSSGDVRETELSIREKNVVLERDFKCFLNDSGLTGRVVGDFENGFISTLNLGNDHAGNDVTAEQFEEIMNHPAALLCTTLALNIHSLAALKRLVKSDVLKRIKHLNLEWYEESVHPKAMKVLANCPHLAGLESFQAFENSFSDEDLECLAGSPYLKNLDLMDLSCSNVTERGAQMIADSDNFSKLEILLLPVNNIGDDGLEIIVNSPKLEEVKSLDVFTNGLTDLSMVHLVRSKMLPQLRYLSFGGDDDLSDEGFALLMKHGRMDNLECLELRVCEGMTSASLFRIANSERLGNLQTLGLEDMDCSDEALLALVESPHLKSLKKLVLGGSYRGKSLPAPVVTAIAERQLGRLKVTW